MYIKRCLKIYLDIVQLSFLTEQQKLDVEKRINHTIPVVNIPVGYSETIDTPVQTLDQRSVKLISVARYSPEKQLHQQIELIKRLVSYVQK